MLPEHKITRGRLFYQTNVEPQTQQSLKGASWLQLCNWSDWFIRKHVKRRALRRVLAKTLNILNFLRVV